MISHQLPYGQLFTIQTKNQQFSLGSVAAKIFLDLSTTKYGTNFHEIQIMSVSVDKLYFIKHADISTIYGSLKTDNSKQKNTKFSAIHMLAYRYGKKKTTQRLAKNKHLREKKVG